MLNPMVSFIYFLSFIMFYLALRKRQQSQAKAILSAIFLSCVIGTVFVAVAVQLGLRLYLTI